MHRLSLAQSHQKKQRLMGGVGIVWERSHEKAIGSEDHSLLPFKIEGNLPGHNSRYSEHDWGQALEHYTGVLLLPIPKAFANGLNNRRWIGQRGVDI